MDRRTFIKVLLLGSGSFVIGSPKLITSALDNNMLRLVMLYNNMGHSQNLMRKWGVAIWIEDKDTAVLFDTGGDPSALWKNIATSGVDIKKLSKIIISHNHWDHVNGLPIVLEQSNYKPDVLVPEFDLTLIEIKNPRARLTGIKKPEQINDYLWSTGQMKASTWQGTIHEQSIMVLHNHSIFLLTGCSHPGIVKIVERAQKIHPDKQINLIAGGFHLMHHSIQQVKKISARLKRLQVNKIAPSHCNGDSAIHIFNQEWKESFVDFNIGNSIRI